jgi:hypothetical protein
VASRSRVQQAPGVPGGALRPPNRRAAHLVSAGRFPLNPGTASRHPALAETRSVTLATRPGAAETGLPIPATASLLPGVAGLRPLARVMTSSLPGGAGPCRLTRASARLVLLTVVAQPAAPGPADGTACPLARLGLLDWPARLDWLALSSSLVPAYPGATRPVPRAGTAGRPARLGLFARRFPTRVATGGWLPPAEPRPGPFLPTRPAGPLTPTQDRAGTVLLVSRMSLLVSRMSQIPGQAGPEQWMAGRVGQERPTHGQAGQVPPIHERVG